MSSPLDLTERIYRLILRAYPTEYQEAFGDEMCTTFLEGACEAKVRNSLGFFILREVRDMPGVLIGAYWEGWKKKIQDSLQVLYEVTRDSDLPPAAPDGRDSWKQVLFEWGLFFFFGITLILATYLPNPGLTADWQRDFTFLGRFIIPLTLPIFLFGLARGLPRWAYPSGGLLLSYYGFILNQTSLWLFVAILFLAASTLALTAILTDPQPSLLPISIRRILQSLSLDWTRLSYALYGAMPLVILLAFDDSRYNNRTPYFAFSVLAMMAGGLFYSLSRHKPMQMIALLAGVTFSVLGAWLDRVSFTNGLLNWIIVPSRGSVSDLWIFKLGLQWFILILSPILLSMIEKRMTVRQVM